MEISGSFDSRTCDRALVFASTTQDKDQCPREHTPVDTRMAATYYATEEDLFASFSGSNYDGSGSQAGSGSDSGPQGSGSAGLDADFGFDPEMLYLAGAQPYGGLLPTGELATKQYPPQPRYDQLNTTSRSSLSNASSPGYPYSVPGSSTTQSTSAFELPKPSSPSPPLLDRTIEIARLQHPQRQPIYASHGAASTHGSASFQPGSHFRNAALPPSQPQHPQQYPPNYHPTHSVSPPDSATSASSWQAQPQHPPVQHQVDNETLVRMIAEAQAQGQANPGNYYSAQHHLSKPVLQPQPNYSYSHQPMPLFQQQQQGFVANNYAPHPVAFNPREEEQELKKRRTSGPVPIRASTKGTKAKVAKTERKSISPPVVSPPQQRPMVLDQAMKTFDFSNTTNAAVESARSNSIYDSVELIAGAGMHDARRDSRGTCYTLSARSFVLI